MVNVLKTTDIEKNYKLMVETVKLHLEDEKDIIANLSNISAIINSYVDDLNWVGFYILKGEELVLGPFQGMPACVRIKRDKGVCFSAVNKKDSVLVPNVHEFPGHIACDETTNSELVVPIFKGEKVWGVIDLDSPKLNRFTKLEEKYIKEITNLIEMKGVL